MAFAVEDLDPSRRRDPRRAAAVGVPIALAVTLAVTVDPDLAFSYQRATLRASTETALVLASVVVGYLALGRYRSDKRVADLLVLQALAVLAIVNFGFATVPGWLALDDAEELVMGATPVGRACAAALLAAAAALDRPAGWNPPRLLGLVIGVPAAIVTAVVLLRPRLLPVLPDIDRLDRTCPLVDADVVLILLPATSAALLAAAAWGFLRRFAATDDCFSGWLGAGCALVAVANVQYALFPFHSPGWFHTGDLIRVCGYGLWLAGAGSEISTYREGLAVAEERRRLARELHDGLAQELAFITTQGAALSRSARDDRAGGKDLAGRLEDVSRAGQRALDEARRAIAALTDDPDEPLEELVARTAEDVAIRVGLTVRLDTAATDRHLDPRSREAVVRIVREAVTNAARHAGAEVVTVELADEQGVLLRVHDDGEGFDPERCRPGFGLTSMRERAAAIGADLLISSSPGRGTTVELRCR